MLEIYQGKAGLALQRQWQTLRTPTTHLVKNVLTAIDKQLDISTAFVTTPEFPQDNIML